ncbi:hypothetical protein [Nonomuraea sp. NPDC002799]
MADRRTVVIPTYEKTPQGAWERNTKPEIKRWLDNTDPFYVSGTGQTYVYAASKIEAAIASLEEHAAKIANVWKGPDAAKARHALEMLHASGNELSTKLNDMGTALQSYSGHLETAQAKVNEKQSVPSGLDASEQALAQETLDNTHAQRVLHELNQKIKTVYDVELPREVSYELPTVSLPTAPITTRTPDYPTGTEISTGSNNNSGSSGDDETGGNRTTGSNTGGPTTGSNTGGPTTGSNTGGPNTGDSNTGGSETGGSDSGEPGQDGSDGSDDPGTQDPGTQDPGTGQDPGSQNPGDDSVDGTVPPVIGAADKTVTDAAANPTDPRLTDMANYQPPTTITPPTTSIAPPSTAYTPPSSIFTPTPVGASPGIPSVIGSPGVGGQALTAGPGAARGLTGASGGMPLMPFMGGGGAIGEHADLERSTFLAEDSSAWTTGHNTTDPVIG